MSAEEWSFLLGYLAGIGNALIWILFTRRLRQW